MSKTWTRTTGSLLALALVLMFGGMAQAQTAAPAPAPAPKATATAKKAPASMVATGTITSIDATHLVISHKVSGKDTPMNFILTPTTKQDSSLAAGSKVSVRYHKENSDEVATSVSAQTTTAKAKTPKAAAGAKKS
jgi:hypothetical protein